MEQKDIDRVPAWSHPVWGAWIEMEVATSTHYTFNASHPVWGAWIEILVIGVHFYHRHVAPRVGCVD